MKSANFLLKTLKIISIMLVIIFIASSVVIAKNIYTNNDILGDALTTEDGLKYSIKNDNTIAIEGYSGTAATVKVPETIDGYNVTAIGTRAFYYSTGIRTVIIPEGVQTIGLGAFEHCSSLSSVSLPDSVITIEDFAFKACTELSTIKLPKNLSTLGESVFTYDDSLMGITISEENNYFSSTAGVLFNKDMTELVCFPKGKINTKYSVPDTVTKIGSYGFFGCTNLTQIDIPESVTQIGERAFFACRQLDSISIPGSVSEIEAYTFTNCTGLKSIKFTSGVSKIEKYALMGCDNLISVYIPSSTLTMDDIFGNSSTDKIVIHCDKFSAAEYYAKEHNINYEYTKEIELVKGDLNSDGKVSATDLLLLKRKIVRLIQTTSRDYQVGDMNGDGKLTATDLVTLKQMLVGLVR